YKKRRHADELVKEALTPLKMPRSVVDVLCRALAFDPKKRLAKVDELQSELQGGLDPLTEEQLRLPPTPQPPPKKKTAKGHEAVQEPLTPTTPESRVTPPAAQPAVGPVKKTPRGFAVEVDGASAVTSPKAETEGPTDPDGV